MAFFQNPFPADFRCNLLLSDRQYNIVFVINGNTGRSEELVMAFNAGPFDLSGNDSDGNSSAILNIVVAQDRDDFRNWNVLPIDVTTTAVSVAAVTVDEIASALNANTTFSSFFTAFVSQDSSINGVSKGPRRVFIRSRQPAGNLRFYIQNGQAEEELRFNARAGVGEAVCTCSRDTIEERFNHPEGANHIIELDPAAAGGASNVDDFVISEAVSKKGVPLGLDPASPQADWELLNGRSGLFTFKNITVDGTDRITQIIEYPAGAEVGDLGKQTNFTYTGTNTNPSEVTEVPHCLETGDLITPP